MMLNVTSLSIHYWIQGLQYIDQYIGIYFNTIHVDNSIFISTEPFHDVSTNTIMFINRQAVLIFCFK